MSYHIREVEVSSLGDLIQAVTPAAPDPQSGRLRDSAVYRGSVNVRWHLLTSLDRLGMPDSPPHAKGHLETYLLRGFIRYSRPYLPIPPSNDWEFVVMAQHYGLPTRLLDWTYSPLVAAHMATLGGDPGKDRVVWKLDWRRVHERFDIPPLALMVGDLDRVLHMKGFGSLWELFEGRYTPQMHFVCMLEPPALDERIVAQSATFTLSSDKTRALDEILSQVNLAEAMTRFIIPARRVGLVRDQLDLCSVDERRLFPDLGGVAAAMRRYYSATATERAGDAAP